MGPPAPRTRPSTTRINLSEPDNGKQAGSSADLCALSKYMQTTDELMELYLAPTTNYQIID
jgi:hypothetical protein